MSSVFAIFSANYLPNIGGVEKYTQNLAKALESQGHRTIVITNNVFNLADHEEESPGIDIIRLPCHNVLAGRYPIPRRNRQFANLLERITSQKIDYVVINTRFYLHTLLGIWLAEKKGIKPIIIDHGSAHLTMGSKFVDVFVSTYEHVITEIVKRHSSDYYAVSKKGMEWMQHFGIQAKGVLCNSIDAQEFRSQSSCRDFRTELNMGSDDFIVAFTGRFIPEKGIVPLLEAADILRNEKVHFLLAGEGPLRKNIDERHLPNVHVLGKLNASDISALLICADAFCLPSRSEGFATSLLEAAACGTTPIITHVGGVDELMPSKEYGLLLNEATPDNIVSCIRLLKDAPTLNQQIASNIQKRAEEEFSWAVTAQRLQEACKLACSG